jgi:hypothetical protein
MSVTASFQQNVARVGINGEIQTAITLDLPVLHWLFEGAVPLKGERVARASWNAYLKNNPKTLNHPYLCHLVKY